MNGPKYMMYISGDLLPLEEARTWLYNGSSEEAKTAYNSCLQDRIWSNLITDCSSLAEANPNVLIRVVCVWGELDELAEYRFKGKYYEFHRADPIRFRNPELLYETEKIILKH